MSTLPSQISDLSIAEKVELLGALWEDIEAHAPALSDEQEAELDRRVAEYERNPSDVIPWEQLRAELFKH
ncbi:addiction module protein [Granulicella tundricola]|uniref:Addiction module component, TIGR02574 family n=1 Tax=Granulicella tundricola (strain ATCC BAA-1859 / DSM 23138 / MP5ACTX9) TaxID=1198114 RepID=E8WZC8_GRATM|nr:addiction module protein [Granulicella tundricola]ADW68816.1 addiction module component, TIGR02574 family [Granulicella tundricola MP5ACTX9]